MSSRRLCEVLVPVRDSTEEQSVGRAEARQGRGQCTWVLVGRPCAGGSM